MRKVALWGGNVGVGVSTGVSMTSRSCSLAFVKMAGASVPRYRVRCMFEAVGATHRWGLSGTPPISNRESLWDVAYLLWSGWGAWLASVRAECNRIGLEAHGLTERVHKSCGPRFELCRFSYGTRKGRRSAEVTPQPWCS